MSSETFELNCPFCDKLYKLPREKVLKHAGKMIHCRKCGKPFSIPALPSDEAAVDEIPIAVVAEPEVVKTPVEEEPPPVGGSVSEAIEPPSLSEYETTSTAHEEAESAAGNLSEQDAEAIASMGLSEDPPSYFGAPEVTRETVELSGESAFSMKAVEPVEETRGEEAGETKEPMEAFEPIEINPMPMLDEEPSGLAEESEEAHLEPPPPPLPFSEPVPPPTKPARNERISVKPVFDAAEEEEPVPRRRRFGKRAEPVAPAEVDIPAVAEEPSELAKEAPVEMAVDESVSETPQALREPMLKEDAAEIAEPESAPTAVREDKPILADVGVAPPVVPENILGVWVAIRRAVMLLAVMSVVIAVVLVAILLAIMGIIPKR